MEAKNTQGYDPRPIFDIGLVPLLDHFKSVRAMKMAAFKAALPDLAIAGTFLYSIIMFLELTPAFRSNMEGLIIIELIVLIVFPVMFRVFASAEKAEFRASPKLRFMTGWINIFNLLFILTIMVELAFLTSIAEGRKWIPLQLFILTATKVYAVFFSGAQKVKPIAFCAKLTARLVGGLFFGLFTYFIAAITIGLLLNPPMLSEICMLLVGYVFFAMMGIYTLFKQDFLYILGAPFKNDHEDDKEMICEICYPRVETPLPDYKIPLDADVNQKTETGGQKAEKQKKSYVFVILLAVLLLPAICLLPMRSKMIEHSKITSSEIHKSKVVWEERFNLGAGIIFGTSMLWIFFVVTMMLAREGAMKKK